MPNLQYVTFRDASGMLQAGWAPASFGDTSGMTDDEKSKIVIHRMIPPDVRVLDMNQLQIDLHEAMVRGKIPADGFSRSNVINVVSSVIVRHLDNLE